MFLKCHSSTYLELKIFHMIKMLMCSWKRLSVTSVSVLCTHSAVSFLYTRLRAIQIYSLSQKLTNVEETFLQSYFKNRWVYNTLPKGVKNYLNKFYFIQKLRVNYSWKWISYKHKPLRYGTKSITSDFACWRSTSKKCG
jgi:hypothetical protein